jgi:ABC-2 type transport system permease protein
MFNGTLATAHRVLQQLRHDPRTLVLIWFVPTGLLVLLRFVFDKQDATFNAVGPSLIALFPMTTMFLVTSIATLRERTDGTMERLFTLPLGKAGYLLGYALAFSLMAIVQAAIVTYVSFTWLGLSISGPEWLLFVMNLAVAILGVSLGMLASALAKTEFQAVQFLPVAILPQTLLCGLLVARDQMADWLHTISDYLPLSYVVEALKELRIHTEVTSTFTNDLWIVCAFVVGSLLVGSLTLRRKSA